MSPSATADQLRVAYRALAREHHPDAGHPGEDATMARLNAAWYVLSDPGRRAVYDASLRASVRASPTDGGPQASEVDDDDTLPEDEVVPAHTKRGLLPLPWLLVLGLLAAIFVFTAYAASDHGGEGSTVDGVLQPGSCVVLEGRLAVEVGCDGDHEGVVDNLPPIGAECRPGMTSFDDRTGASTVCVRVL